MSEQIDQHTLLPDNRTTFERSTEEALKALVKSEGVLEWLNDPQATRADLLDVMAKEAGVLDWFYHDDENAKRASIEHAVRIQQRAGTRQGLTEAMSAIGVDAEVERGDKPYSLNIKTWSPAGINEASLMRLAARLEAYKSERDSFAMSVGFKSTGQCYVAGAVVMAPRVIIGPWVPPLVEASGRVYVAGAVITAMKTVIT